MVGWFARIEIASVGRTFLSDAFDFDLDAWNQHQNPKASGQECPAHTKPQALRRGRMVKSLTWVKMLDICIPFSDETNGIISAMNGSFINSLISS